MRDLGSVRASGNVCDPCLKTAQARAVLLSLPRDENAAQKAVPLFPDGAAFVLPLFSSGGDIDSFAPLTLSIQGASTFS